MLTKPPFWIIVPKQPIAEGAEEILNKHRNEPYGIFRAMEEYATLHAQRIADKMVSERLREELIKFGEHTKGWARTYIEVFVDKYLKSREK